MKNNILRLESKKFTLHRVVEIDLEGARLRIKKCAYSKKEKQKLIRLLSLIEKGKLTEASKYVDQKFTIEEKEYIDVDIWEVLFDISMGVKYIIPKKASS